MLKTLSCGSGHLEFPINTKHHHLAEENPRIF